MKRLLTYLALTIAIALPLAFQATMLASASSATCDSQTANGNLFYCACNSAASAQSSTACKTAKNVDNPITGNAGILPKVQTIVSVIGGVAAVIIIIYSGFKFITADGDAQKVANARNTILYTFIGLIILAIADAIIQFVIKGIK